PGLTVRQVLDKFGQMQMIDVHFPTTDHRELVLVRYTQPEKDQKILLAQMKWELPPQSPPRITAKGNLESSYRPLDSGACFTRTYEDLPPPVSKVGRASSKSS